MTVLDASAYESFLELARRGLITFKWDPNKHPRDHNGRWKAIPDMKDGKLGSVMDRETQGLPDNTQDMHTWRNPKHGHRWEYTPERQKLHEAIVEAYLAGKKPADGTPTMLFTAGGAGSGKSYALEQLDIEPPDAVLIDPDDIKVLIPEYEKLAAEGDFRAMHLVHDESIDIAEKLRARVVQDRYNATMDGTGASPQFRDRVGAALDAEYEVKVDYFNTDVATAMKRIADRKKTTGRAVNKWVAWDMHRNTSRIFHDVFEEGVQVRVWDTTAEGKPPTLVMEAEAGAEPEVHDQDAFDSFLKKADAKPAWELQQVEKRKTTFQQPTGYHGTDVEPDVIFEEGITATGGGNFGTGAYFAGKNKQASAETYLPDGGFLYAADHVGLKAEGVDAKGDGEFVVRENVPPAKLRLVPVTRATVAHSTADWLEPKLVAMGRPGLAKRMQGTSMQKVVNVHDVRALVEATEDAEYDTERAAYGLHRNLKSWLDAVEAHQDKWLVERPSPKQVPKARNPKQGALPGFGNAPVLRLEEGARVDSPAGKGEIVKVTGVIVQVLVDGEKKPRRYEVKDLRGV